MWSMDVVVDAARAIGDEITDVRCEDGFHTSVRASLLKH